MRIVFVFGWSGGLLIMSGADILFWMLRRRCSTFSDLCRSILSDVGLLREYFPEVRTLLLFSVAAKITSHWCCSSSKSWHLVSEVC